ncbi:M48 family metallopeptidase [Gaoshiqia sediminis]|uniref:M48 family metallopeptidase n=1 Tax=Gaoshiqia sediminis TaxID=2986998 RepID=A0AA42C9P3_9BACT|nr:M48 family metallopeptidase [Gaoshiqia sediminis]MCW0484261.1 M48 family metallopeptidase [Gaoshiqia sediminis]
MKSILINAFLVTALLVVQSCTTVPLTGRSQLSLLPESSMVEMSLSSYDQFLSENKLSTNQSQTDMIKRVGKRVAAAVEQYLKDNGFESYIETFKWEFNLVESDVPNAWCMPGGKVVFYSGILPMTQNEAGVAVVMGHEIAHAVARHGNERMSYAMVQQMGGIALSEALKEKPAETQALFSTAYGLGSQYGVMLPFSRKHEYEADQMGLIFMAMAGYDPRSAVAFWKRMSESGKSSTPEFLSTHPVDVNRIAALEKLMPEALKYYQGQ